jgi:hypothetical protein
MRVLVTGVGSEDVAHVHQLLMEGPSTLPPHAEDIPLA